MSRTRFRPGLTIMFDIVEDIRDYKALILLVEPHEQDILPHRVWDI